MDTRTPGQKLDDLLWKMHCDPRITLLRRFWRQPRKLLEQWRIRQANERRRAHLTAHWEHAHEEARARLRQQIAQERDQQELARLLKDHGSTNN